MLLNYKIVQLFQHTDHYSSFMTTKTMYKSYVSNLKDEPSVLVFYVNGKRVGGFYVFGFFCDYLDRVCECMAIRCLFRKSKKCSDSVRSVIANDDVN